MSQFWSTVRPGIDLAQDARQKASDARTGVEVLQARLDRTSLICEALWTILRDRLNVPEEELVNRVNDIDLSDGQLDGKVRRAAVKCKCGKTVARRFNKCLYCGTLISPDVFA